MNEPVNYAVQCAIEQAVQRRKAKRKGCEIQKDRIRTTDPGGDDP